MPSSAQCELIRAPLGCCIRANAVEFQIPVVGEDEFVYDSVHSFTIVLAVSDTANRSKTLEPSLVSTSRVTLPA